MAKCKNCRKKRVNNRCPKRPPRGSIRKHRRDAQRAAKRLAMKEAKELRVELRGGETISESIVSVIKLDIEPLSEGRESELVEGRIPPMPAEEVINESGGGE